MTKKGAVAARTAAVKRRTFTREFKLKVIREVEAGKSQAQVAREYQLTENTISKWRRQQRQYQDRAFAGRGHAYTDEARMHELERMVGRLTMENDFLKKLVACAPNILGDVGPLPVKLFHVTELRQCAAFIAVVSRDTQDSVNSALILRDTKEFL